MRAWFAIAVPCAALAIAAASNPQVERVSRKLDLMEKHQAKPGSVIVFSAADLNAWGRAKANIQSNIEGVMSDATAKGQEAVDAVREVSDNMIGAIDESLKKRPYTTLALAVGIGFLFGATWRR